MTTSGLKTNTTRVWYIFIDVVEFTGQMRSMDDMVAIINALNEMVQDLLAGINSVRNKPIILATGDGMCIGLLKSNASTQVKLAFDLRNAVNRRNGTQTIPRLRFTLRTALNIYDDFRIKDINNKPNLIGHGINTAARILGQCQPGEIVVSGYMYSTLEKIGEFMHSFSPEQDAVVKGESYKYRRMELNEGDRTWAKEKAGDAGRGMPSGSVLPPGPKLIGDVPDPGKVIMDMQTALEKMSNLPVEVGAPLKPKKEPQAKWPVPKALVDDPLDEREISDNRLRHVAAQSESWQPSNSEPKQKLNIGQPSYSKEFRLKSPFRSFEALVSPNGDHFKLTMKLMNTDGALGAHKVFGEVSFTVRNDTGTDGIVLGFMEGGEWYERSLPQNPRPRFEVKLEALPIQSNKLYIALLSINGKRVLTKKIPQSFTSRFCLVASGNGGPCHMSFSDITVHMAAK